jgi:general stress protein CsbA
MATRPLRKEPSFPAVELYLDDVQEIVEIITRAFKDCGIADEISIVFKVDGKLECTTVAELQDHGGVAKEFVMTVGSGSFLPLLSTGYSGIKLCVPYELSKTPSAHEVISQLNRIVSDRKSALKTLFRDITRNIYLPMVLLVIFVGFGIAQNYAKDNFLKGVLLTLQTLALMFFVACAYFVWTKSDRVNLYFKRSNEKELAARRRELFGKIALLVIGAALGMVATLVTQHFRR